MIEKTSNFKLQTSIFLLLCCLLFVVGCVLSSCKVYSFTGASVLPDIKTVSVQNFNNQSENGNTAVSQNLTDQLRDKFISETNLTVINSGGDIEFRGTITGYSIRGQAPTAEQTTAINRLTITVKVDYANSMNEGENWTKSFSRYNDYESTRTLAEVEQELYSDINAQLAEDIFNKAFVNW